MIITAIIVEYNPFHNGHQYHINKAKELTNADYIIAIMSGNYVQRGEPALIDKYSRTKMALSSGVDLIIELPVYYSTASAEYFAYGAISIIDKLGIVDYVCFGSECGDINILKTIAHFFNDEPEDFKSLLSFNLKTGQSFPIARKNALIEYLSRNNSCQYNSCDIQNVLDSPNNILGIEYIKALLKLNSAIKPCTINRCGANYNTNIVDNTDIFTSASAIRASIFSSKNGCFKDIQSFIPSHTYNILYNYHNITYPITINDFSLLLYYKLHNMPIKNICDYLDVDETIAHKLSNTIQQNYNIDSLIQSSKTKEITYSRLSRCIIHIILDIKKTSLKGCLTSSAINYARILGFNSFSSHIIKEIKKHEQIKLITKIADAKNILSDYEFEMFTLDINSSNLYNHIVYNKFNNIIKDEYQQGPVRYSP